MDRGQGSVSSKHRTMLSFKRRDDATPRSNSCQHSLGLGAGRQPSNIKNSRHCGKPSKTLLHIFLSSYNCTMNSIDPRENRRRMEAGELYFAFTPDLIADRKRCSAASKRLNDAGGDESRRRLVELWKE